MKNLGICIILVLLFSCDTREDYYLLNNKKPKFTIASNNSWSFNKNQSTTIIDTLKSGFDYKINLAWEDSNPLTLSYMDNLSSTLSYDGIKGNDFLLNNSKDAIINTSTIGDHNIDLKITDPFNESVLTKINLFVFNNLKPVGEFTATKLSSSSNINEYEFDASNSYDKDEKFGGEIVIYSYDISNTQTSYNHTFNSNFSKSLFIFPDTGIYSINLIVYDNNNDQSVNYNSLITVQ